MTVIPRAYAGETPDSTTGFTLGKEYYAVRRNRWYITAVNDNNVEQWIPLREESLTSSPTMLINRKQSYADFYIPVGYFELKAD